MTENLKVAFNHFRSSNIEPVLIKGWAAARYYPDPSSRVSNDIDLCFAPDSFDAAVAASGELHRRGLNLDLHNGLRHLDSASWDLLFERSQLVDVDETAVRVLCPEDHLRVLISHWLADGGENHQRLADFGHLLAAHRDSFDWQKCLEPVSAVRQSWIFKTLGLCVSEGIIDPTSLPFSTAQLRVPKWMKQRLKWEWEQRIKLRPLFTVLFEPKALWPQLRKRIPPNAIQSSYETEAMFDDSSRWRSQVGAALLRGKPLPSRLWLAIVGRFLRK